MTTLSVLPGRVGTRTTPDESGAYAARLGDLRDHLSLLDLDREAFVSRIVSDMSPQPKNFERIVAVNLGREMVDVEAAFERELGPNNCAV